ncbi:hypothetical protein IQ264_17025 [Phormidium sp. LEGE 05292]|uniref:hypothetical protein n=1 Tax=[Phormidium] sp. LEGE 05292 TaxID=767427 RepID=UPI0018816615|nr:hypothetical protein [Phormidium sp. LEGE 05292]MBE9227133.1 hypothetical protein [Phormidium sp. LEGE 05292]
MTIFLPPQLKYLPATLPIEGAVRIELEEGIPVFRASSIVQNQIEALLVKQQTTLLSPEEERELDCYEEIDDYLSFVNRMLRNLSLTQTQQSL